MSYTKLVKQWERESKQKQKKEKMEMLIERERVEKYKENIYFSEMREIKEANEKREKEHTDYIIKVRNFLHEQAKKLNYTHWITLRDVLTNDYFQIEGDLIKGKISENELAEIKQIALQI